MMVSMMRFRLLGVPVAVRPSFLLIAALLGIRQGSVGRVLIWVGVVFVSILVHEFGHALTARRYGANVAIELNGIGGLTTWGLDEELPPGKRALIAAAGSGVGVVLGGIVAGLVTMTGPYSGIAEQTLTLLIRVNLFWGLLNWLPIRPLDGGHLLIALLEKVTPAKAEPIAGVVFMVTPAIGAVLALRYGYLVAALVAGFLLVAEFARFGGSSRDGGAIPDALTFDDGSAGEEQVADSSPGDDAPG